MLLSVPNGIQTKENILPVVWYETITGSRRTQELRIWMLHIDRAMDDVGVDSIEIAVAVAVAMEGGLLPWGW